MRTALLAFCLLLAGCQPPGGGATDPSAAAAWAAVQVALHSSDGVDPTPTPTPEPGKKCTACNGTGRSGDGLGPCGFCGGDGVMDLTPTPQIDWFGKYEPAKERALERKVPVLTVVTASWCEPCERVKREILGNRQVAAYVQENFVACELDFDETPELKGRITELPMHMVTWPGTGKTVMFDPPRSPVAYIAKLSEILSKPPEKRT